MGLINNEGVYPPRTPNSGDTVLGIKKDENSKTVVFPIESLVSLVLSTLVGDAFVSDTFVYNGSDNVFVLTNTAYKVTMVFIENGAYPDQVPTGNVTQVTISSGLLLSGQTVVIHYIKLE